MEEEEPQFYYKIRKYLGKKDGQCEEELISGFHFYRCSNKARENIDGANLCKMHLKSLLNWRKT